jgi:hypothetical protein
MLKYRTQFGIPPYEPEPERRGRYNSLPLNLNASIEKSSSEKDVMPNLSFIPEFSRVSFTQDQTKQASKTVDEQTKAESPKKTSKTFDELASAEVLTRGEYSRLKEARPQMTLGVKYIVSEVRPNSVAGSVVTVLPVTPAEGVETALPKASPLRMKTVVLATESAEMINKEPSTTEQSQAATRPATTIKAASAKQQAVPRRATVGIFRPLAKQHLDQGIRKDSRRPTTRPNLPDKNLRARMAEYKVKRETEMLEKYQQLVSHSPNMSWGVML